jgi:hypothetical protein
MSYLDDNFHKWCDQWQDAQAKGIFDTPKKDHVPSASNDGQSFFGGLNKKAPSENVKDVDAKYWNDLYNMSKDYGSTAMIDDYLSGELMQESAVAEKQKTTPNPVKVSSLGKDTDAAAVGVHYNVDEFKGLEGLKIKLHGLLDKLNGMESKGQSPAKLESQIQALEKQIDELSNHLCCCDEQ